MHSDSIVALLVSGPVWSVGAGSRVDLHLRNVNTCVGNDAGSSVTGFDMSGVLVMVRVSRRVLSLCVIGVGAR